MATKKLLNTCKSHEKSRSYAQMTPGQTCLQCGHKQCLCIHRYHSSHKGLSQQWSHDYSSKGADCSHHHTQRHISICQEGDYVAGCSSRTACHQANPGKQASIGFGFAVATALGIQTCPNNVGDFLTSSCPDWKDPTHIIIGCCHTSGVTERVHEGGLQQPTCACTPRTCCLAG